MLAGSGWFLAQLIALWLGTWSLAVLFAAAAGLAAGQLARSWWVRDERADVALSILVGSLLPLAAAVHTAAVGAVVVAGAAVSVAAAAAQRGPDTPPLRDAGYTIQSWLPVGLAAAAVVLMYRYEPGGAFWMLCLVAIFDSGNYLVGAGSTQRWDGPVAGVIGIGVVGFALTVIGVPPLDSAAATRFAIAAMLLVPAGLATGAALSPSPDAKVGALRRLDSLLLMAPVWAWSVGRYLASQA